MTNPHDDLRSELRMRSQARDADPPGVKHDPSSGQFAAGGGGGSSSSEKTKISKEAMRTKLEGMPHARLMSALNNKDVDPAIKKMIEKELDDRADRGTSKGFGEK